MAMTMMKAKKQTQRKAAAKSARPAPIPRAVREKVLRLLQENYSYMDSPTFRRKHVEEELFTEDAVRELPVTSWYQPTRDDLADVTSNSPPQLMKAPEERLMFQRFNYCKKRLSALQKKIDPSTLTLAQAQEFLDWHRKFEHFREYLVRTNLALVLAMAKRTRLGDVDFAEIVSEGNMALLRAVDKFSVDRGFKFSTYACRAILKAFSRTAMKASKHRTRFPVEFEPDMEQSDWADRRRDAIEDDCIDELKAIVDRNLADLSSVEQTVIRRRFNWQQNEESGLTLEEVGKIIGVTKERVRQIQNKALAKIRSVMEDGVLRIHPRTEEESRAYAESRSAETRPNDSRLGDSRLAAIDDLAVSKEDEANESDPLVVGEPTIAHGSATI
jgi:RNA polymerase sigma factor (sigma-70 family)